MGICTTSPEQWQSIALRGDAEAIQDLIKGAEEAVSHANDTIKALTNN